jgi:hypothetical protein
MLGETSATQMINANLNTTYDMNFFGGWTFNSKGAKGNGVNTFVNSNKYYTGTDLQNTHFSVYGTLVGNTPSNRGDLTIINLSISNMDARISLNDISGVGGIYEYIFGTYSAIYPADSGDFVVITNDGGVDTYGYRNGVYVYYNNDYPVLSGTDYLYLGVSRQSGSNLFSTNRYGWVSFGGYMSPSDISTYQTIVNTFMTSIGRNTY